MQKNKIFGKRLLAIFFAVLCLAFCCGNVSLAAEVPETPVVDGGLQKPEVKSKYVVVLGYELKNPEDTKTVEALYPGAQALLKVYLLDPRLLVQESGFAWAQVDADAFEILERDPFLGKDAGVSRNGMALTLTFPVRYLGESDVFAFRFGYDGSLAKLEQDEVEIKISQCRLQALEGESPESEFTPGEEIPGEEHVPGGGTGENILENPGENPGGAGALMPEENAEGQVIRTSLFAVKGVSYGGEPVVAGTDFDCTIHMMVTDGDENINNALVSLALPYGISFVGDNDRIYLGTLKAGYSYDVTFKLHADESFSKDKCRLTVNLTGTSSYFGTELEHSDTAEIAVSPVERLAISGMSIPEKINSAYDDGGGRMSFTLENKGYAAVTDIEVSVVGDDFIETEHFFADELKPSESVAVTLNLVTETDGALEGHVSVSYTDASGREKFLEEPLQVQAEYRKAVFDHNIVVDPSVMQEKPLVPDWVWVVVTLGAVAGGTALVRKAARVFGRRAEVL